MAIDGRKLLIASLDSHCRKFSQRFKTCRSQPSEAAVHDLRTSARRLLSLLELFHKLTPKAKLGKLRQNIKAQLDGFDDLRDTQVMLQEVGAAMAELPELAPFLEHLQQREQQLLLQVQTFFQTVPVGKLKRKLKNAHGRCKRLTAKRNINTEVLSILDNLFLSAVNRNQAVDPNQLPSIHHLRIAVKKLRYTLVAAYPLLTNFQEQRFKAIEAYLTLLGDIQNSAVLLTALELYFTEETPANIQTHFRQQQQTLITKFMSQKDELLGFWQLS